jgi:hypothetical protein
MRLGLVVYLFAGARDHLHHISLLKQPHKAAVRFVPARSGVHLRSHDKQYRPGAALIENNGGFVARMYARLNCYEFPTELYGYRTRSQTVVLHKEPFLKHEAVKMPAQNRALTRV